MRCFRIDEDVHTGIPLKTLDDNCLGIEVGDETLLLDEAFSNTLTNAKQRVVDKLKSCLGLGTLDDQPLTSEELEKVGGMMDFIEPESIKLIYADVGSGNDLVRESRRSPDALVLVETVAGINGYINFLSTTYDECIDQRSKRVRREYREIFPPPGVTVVKEGKTTQGSSCYVLRMMPNSSIRIERNGALDGAPSILTIVWKGRKGKLGSPPLLMFSPDRRQE